jgi:hypothetical protein
MQTIKKTAVAAVIAFISVTVFSFSPAGGGDKCEIYINNKLVVENFISHNSGAKTVTLFPGNYNNRIDVYYSHCGQTGKNRSLVLKDAQNKVIKKWEFADASGSNKAMSLKGKDIMDLQKEGNGTLKLFYSSKELPDGKMVASVVKATTNYASVR